MGTVCLLKIIQKLALKNVVHGDLWLANVVFTDKGQIHLVDWGTARFHDEDTKSEIKTSLNYRCLPIIAAMRIISDKRAGKKKARTIPKRDDKASDVWSLGNLVSCLLVGQDIS